MFKKKKIEEEVVETLETPTEAAEVQAGVEVASEMAFEEGESIPVHTITDLPEDAEESPVVEPVREGTRYNGSLVIEKLDTVNGDGRLCRLEDGSTAFVPLAILGESTDA